MIVTYMMIFLTLILGACFLYISGTMLDNAITWGTTQHSSIFTGDWLAFLQAVNNWKAFLLILLPLLLWVAVQSQRPREEYV